MSRKTAVLDYLLTNPFATNEEIASAVNINEDYAKVIISRLKNDEKIEITERTEGDELENKRYIEVISLEAEKPNLKRDIYKSMLDVFIEDFENAGTFDERLEIGKVVIRLLEKL